MLSIGKLVDGQQRYYERTVAQGHDDYYSGRGEAPGVWMGRGAARLGLEGRVDAGQFNALMAGNDPRQPHLRLRSLASDPQVAGFDLTFSAPKSVSVLFAIVDEQTSGELIRAHNSAVAAALEYVQDAAVFVRRGKGGRVFERTGLVAAAYRHRMSRSLDPQLHTHVVCANLAEGDDGRWTALHHPSLYVHAQTAGYLYEAHLRAEVRERLGLEWGPVTKGIAELVDVDEDVRLEFSRRRQQMLEACAADPDTRMDTKQRAAAVAIATRDRKQYGVETGSWREEVRARAAEHGLDRQAVDAIVAGGRAAHAQGLPVAGVDERAVGDLLAGPAGLTERSNTFGEREVLRAQAEVARQGAAVEELRARAGRFGARADVWPTANGEMTTAELIACERRLIAAAVGRGEEGCAVLDAGVLDDGARSGSPLPLTSEQAAAVRAVTGSGHGVDVIEARAGTGKTFIAGVIRSLYEQAGHRVLGVAPTGRAARELTEEAGLPARTLDRLLLDLSRGGGRFQPSTVIVFDEAGMASTRLSEQLLAAAEVSGAKVIAIGDPGQLASVRAGGWMRALSQRLGRQRLLEVHRQRDHGERRALAALHDRKPWLYLEWARHHQRITVHAAGAITSVLAQWTTALAVHGPREAVLIARDNETRQRLNQFARAHRRERDEIGEDVAYGPVRIAVGDRVIARQNDSLADVDNGTRGTVRATFEDRVVIETDAGTLRELPAGYVSEHLEHAYCLTGHGMQGGTVEHATVLATPRDLTAGWSYTALSRARGATRLHIDAGEHAVRVASERAELAPHDAATPAPEPEDVLEQVARRMLVRDDQDLAVDELGARASLAGFVNDQRVHESRVLGPQPQEHAAERGEYLAPADLAAQLRELADQTQRLRAQVQGLPLEELRRLDCADQQRADIGGQRAAAAATLAALPQPRRRLGRMHDPHAVERARLASAVSAADRQLAALERQHAQLQARVGSADQLRSERDGLERRLEDLERTRQTRLDQGAQSELARRPDWLMRTLGPCPDDRRLARWWDRAATGVARYRVEHSIPEGVDGVGPKPDRDKDRSRWRSVARQLSHAQRELNQQELGRDR